MPYELIRKIVEYRVAQNVKKKKTDLKKGIDDWLSLKLVISQVVNRFKF